MVDAAPGRIRVREAGVAIAFTFPGQGSQEVGMGKALAEAHASARDVFAEVDAALDQKLSTLMWEGPESELTLTENAQPALMAVSMAVMRVLEREHGVALRSPVKFVAGHSLGEYSALAAAGTFSLADTARLLKIRGRAMQEATPSGVGAMAALLGLDLTDVLAIAEEAAQGEICAAANDNAQGQVVVSGHRAAVARAIDIAKAKGAKRAILLTVSAPFHCPLMKPAAEAMAHALAGVAMRKPLVPLIANVTADASSAPDVIRDQLIRQVTGMVRWRESVAAMASAGCDIFCELGAGKVLSGLARRNAPQARAIALGTPSEIVAGASLLQENAHAV
jgi:[acyl-carrier-protein] S-malonyltransferase